MKSMKDMRLSIAMVVKGVQKKSSPTRMTAAKKEVIRKSQQGESAPMKASMKVMKNANGQAGRKNVVNNPGSTLQNQGMGVFAPKTKATNKSPGKITGGAKNGVLRIVVPVAKAAASSSSSPPSQVA